jgi:AcrR family transcriptional regulator
MPRRPRTAPRRKPVQRRAEDTVAIPLEATERVVTKEGFHGATTNHIAETAGVSIGTLYHYFPTKEALVEAVVHRMWQDELAILAQSADALTTKPLDESIDLLIQALVGVVTKKLGLYRRWYAEASHLGQLDVGLAMTNAAIAVVQSAFERHATTLLPRDPAFAADLVVKTVLAVVRTGTRDYETQMKDGTLARELSAMMRRYLLP